MKRKHATAGTLRLSPNEEAMFLKEEYERRRKLRLQQVREQQKYISYQIRQKVKQRREEHLHQLEEALRAEWQKAQDEKMKALEELYLSSLRAIGEGHRRAKENEPDLEALAKQAEERKQRAETRHRKALIEQKHQKEKLLREQARRADARKRALEVERQRAAKVASLPPPPPRPFESFEVKKILGMKPCGAGNFSVTRYHIAEALVDREVDGEQPDAHLAAEEEGRRLEELHREAERERRKQLEKAHIRGSHALKKIQLAKDRERLQEELEQMHAQDRMRRRQGVAQMPPQLSVPPYKRMEIKEEWQRELESAFEEMCSEDRNMKGDLILQFEPQPLPAPSDRAQDNDLDISLEHESACDTQPELPCDTQQESGHVIDEEVPNEPERHEEGETCQPRSKLALKKLLNKIRSQKEEWTSKSEKESQSEFETIESGTIASEKRPLCDVELNKEQQKNTVSEAKDSMKMLENTVADEKSVPIHPQEQAAKIRMEEAAKIRMEEERQKWNEEIEKQKQEQLALIKKIEEEKALLEADYLKIQMQTCLEQAKKKKEEEEQSQLVQSHSLHSTDQQNQMEHETGNVSETRSPGEDSHRQTIRNFQQRLLQQKRLHKQTIEEARKNLQEYQNTLRQRYLSASEIPLSTRETKPINVEPVSEPPLQKQGAQPTQYQASEQVHVQSLPVFSGAVGMLEKPSSQKQQEQVHNICPGKSVQFSEASELKHGGFHLPCDCSSQEQVGIFETANNHIRELFQSCLPSGSVRKEVTAIRAQPEAHQQHFRFVLPAESSSESSETVHSKELLQKISNYPNKTEAEEQHPFKTSLMPATKRSALADALAYQQGSLESSSKMSPDQPLKLSEPTILVHEESKAQGVEEFSVSKAGDASWLNYSGILSLRDRVLASSESIQAQQKYLKELQEQLDAQREALLSKQRIQEKLLLQKQDKLKEQMQRQQEALKELLNKQVRHMCPNEKMTEAQKPVRINGTDFFQVSENYQQENCGGNKFHGSETISRCIGPVEQTEQSEKVLCREQKWRSSKPPVTKVKLGLGLEQHELSVIPEVDTPKSCSLSLAGKTDGGTGETSQVSTSGEFACVKHHSHALREDAFPLGITHYEGKASNGSPRQSSPSGRLLQELLMMAAETSCDSAQSQDSQVSQDSPAVAAEGGERLRTSSRPSFRLDNTEVPGSEASMQRIPCDGTSTVSTGTFSTSERLNASPLDTGLSSDGREDGILRETGSHPRNSSLPFTLQRRQEHSSGASESQLSEGEMCFYKENQIQQILGRSTGNLSSCSEDSARFQALATELCFPEMEGPFPNFHHQIFQPLEPTVDFDTSSSSSCSQYRISQHSKDFIKTSELLTGSPDVSTFLDEENAGLNGQRSSLPSSLEKSGQNISSEEGLVRENVTPGSEESFHPLQLESTLSDDCQNADQPGDMNIVSQRPFEQPPGMKNRGNESCITPASGYEELSRSMGCINLQGSVEDLQNESLIHLEEPKSFYQLDPVPVTMDESFPQQSVKETVSSEKLPLEAFDKKYVKLPEKSVPVDEVNKAVELHSQCNMDIKEPDQSFPEGQESLRVLRETNLEDSDMDLHTVGQNSSLFQGHENPLPRSSCHVPVWETESGHGIMEEPELTLISSNDISIVESDTEHPHQEKIKQDAMHNSACVDQPECNVYPEEREFLPLTPDADYSAFIRPDSSPKAQSPNKSHCPSQQTAVMLLEFAATPGHLQKSFLKRKQNFIQESLKRVEAIKNKEREHEKLEARKLLGGKSENLRSRQKSGLLSGKNGALANQLKKVGEVKVSSPEDRKSGEIEMHQRTSRLYNQLSEVKIRNEEKRRQETYAKNREKAKEFQKKMLEKLRAKKTWKAP
ncbi:centrosomal protein of 295 kDa isoform X1 [Passer montanus]|uniref:centrosomal protein of 295 kDa isoform X1 n=1 Tax=Passer montanus TaxID=9160 RepID=UPI00196114C7|nr:centrosomal protein of 295 kDa isoform X1 [Passer montanus]XP_039574507.1 centrosomal protein of 295 kDa isoform X1 [Passer montanus]XP_039574508.1 centrosomal protein of 295 kDa isoform X1 [Passer montanus]